MRQIVQPALLGKGLTPRGKNRRIARLGLLTSRYSTTYSAALAKCLARCKKSRVAAAAFGDGAPAVGGRLGLALVVDGDAVRVLAHGDARWLAQGAPAMPQLAPTADDAPVETSEPATALVASSLSTRSEPASCAQTLHGSSDNSGKGNAPGTCTAEEAREADNATSGVARDGGDGDGDDGGMQPVKRRVTTGTVAPPPYTIHSHRMRWFIVSLVALAGLFSFVLLPPSTRLRRPLPATRRHRLLHAEAVHLRTLPCRRPLSANIYFPVIPAVAQDLGVSVENVNISVTVYMILQGALGASC